MGLTAYEEALAKISSGQNTSGRDSRIPSYMVAGDTLNVGNKNQTFLESAGETLSNIPQFIGASIISGANQIYNIPTDIGNLLGGDFDRSDTGEVIASIDSNLGLFYQEHQEGVDLVGFIASSTIPGIGGIKVLNAGQKSLRAALGKGVFGENTAKALGLLVPDKGAKIAKAVKEVSNNSSVANLSSRNALRAIGAGIGQNTLEAFAFETAVTATLFKSPILENQDVGDFALNVAFGAAAFGVIGGVIDGTKINSALKGAADKAALEARPWVFIEDTAQAAKGYEKIALDFEQLHAIPKVPTAGVDATRVQFLQQAADTKVATLQGRIREELGVLSGGDQSVAENLFQLFKTQSESTQKSAFIGLVETTKFSAKSKIASSIEKLGEKIRKNPQKVTAQELEDFATSSVQVAYAKVWGENAGTVFSDKPIVTAMSDILSSANAKIKVTTTGVKAGRKRWNFNTAFNVGKKAGNKRKAWNILVADPLEANARYAWAAHLPPIKPTAKSPYTVHVDDIPLMEKVMTDVATEDLVHVRFVGLKEGEGITDGLQNFIGARKIELSNKLLRVRGERGTRTKILQKETTAAAKAAEKEAARVAAIPTPTFVLPIQKGAGILAEFAIGDLTTAINSINRKLDSFRQSGSLSDVTSASQAVEKLSVDLRQSLDTLTKPQQKLLKGELSRLEKAVKDARKSSGKKEAAGAAEEIVAPEIKNTLVQDEIAAIVNVKSSLLSGDVIRDATATYHLKDMLALQSHAEDYTNFLRTQGTRKRSDGVVNIWEVPQHIKMVYDNAPFAGINNHVVENMVIIKQQQKLYQEGLERAAAPVLGADGLARLQNITTAKVQAGAVPSGAGSSLFAAASQNYGSLAATVQDIGRVTASIIKREKDIASEALEPLLYKLGNNQKAYLEWSALEQRVRSIEGEYGINVAGDALEPVVLLRWKQAVKEANELGTAPPPRPTLTNPAMEARIELQTQEVRDLARAHIEINGDSTRKLAGIRTAQGLDFNRAPDVFYPVPVNPKDFPFFALVADESITSGNHFKTLFASSAEELGEMTAKLKNNPHLTVYTKGEADRYFKQKGEWDYEKSLSNNYLDVEAHRKGVSAPFFVPTDPKKITSSLLNWHLQRKTGMVREAIAAKYEVQFKELKSLGEEATNVGLSKFSNMNTLEFAEESVKNPFGDYIKTALAVRKTKEYPWWTDFNSMLDEGVSRVLKRASAIRERASTADELGEINTILQKAGYKGAAYDESMEIFANATPAKGSLAKTVQKANSLMATIVLRWDALNAVNNAVSANVLLGAETKAIVRAISRGDSEAVGALAQLTRIGVPGTEHTIFSPTKLIANAIRDFGTKTPQMQFYRDNGYITSISAQYRESLDALTFTGRESIQSWDNRINTWHAKARKAGDVGEFLTGNRLAEEFNRFVAADVMRQMSDVAVSRGLMTGKEQLAYINTFVNRTQGNYLASQRPIAFQGAVGQAVGLFQTYQFNLMQQLLRHVGEGHAKDAMTLLALQGTIHGMNGLPAFNALNTHLIGTASGNTAHRDAYDAVYGIAGKEGGDWLMYGVGSNAMGLLHPDLKLNLYTRGDINPRHVTILPTDPSQVAIVQATGKFMKNIFNTAGKLAAGGDISTTLLQGLEHNGISRPLAGIAQTLEGLNNPLRASYSTSKKGNVIASNDLLSWANLGRVVGGKPLDEAIALDATYRFKSYGLADAAKRQVLGQAIKTNMIAGQEPTQEQIEDFALKYAEAGGRQEEFNKWFGQLYKTANLSQANKVQQSLNSPFTQSMQRIMGGRELRDFSDQ